MSTDNAKPRCWRHVEGFGDDTNYIEWNGADIWLVMKSGRRKRPSVQEYTYADCMDFESRGIWYGWDPTSDFRGSEL